MNDRQPIMTGYAHISAWIASCFTTEHLNACRQAMEAFERMHAHHSALPTLIRDLELQLSARRYHLSILELAALKNADLRINSLTI